MNKKQAIDFLESLIININSQNNRGVASPYYFTILDYEKISCEEGYNEDQYDLLREGDAYTLEEAIEHFELHQSTTEEELLRDHEFEKWHYQLVEKKKGFFLTEQSARMHFETNRYRYSSRAMIYVSHAFRNHELESLLQAISVLTGIELDKK